VLGVATDSTASTPLPWLLVIGGVVVCLVASGFYSGSETGLMSTSRVRLRRALGQRQSGQARSLLSLLARLDEPILTCLIGTNLFNVMGSAMMTAALTARYGTRGELLTLVIMSVLIILLAEILPKILFREHAERLTLAAVPLLRASMIVVFPLLWLLRIYTRLLLRALPGQEGEIGPGPLDRQAVSNMLLTHLPEEGQDRSFRRSLRRYLSLVKTDLTQVMQPMASVKAVPLSATVATCRSTAASSGFSRLLVLTTDLSKLLGWLQVQDLLFLAETVAVTSPLPPTLVRTCLLVDAGMSPFELFEELHASRQELAVVVDRQGEALGLVTLEDLVETIVGSIQDEFDHTATGTELRPAG
jgi:CBS domain containing-hemolysin-like protein